MQVVVNQGVSPLLQITDTSKVRTFTLVVIINPSLQLLQNFILKWCSNFLLEPSEASEGKHAVIEMQGLDHEYG